jgi:hypothetical protein
MPSSAQNERVFPRLIVLVSFARMPQVGFVRTQRGGSVEVDSDRW